MNIHEIQEQIDRTEYWDVKILNLNISFFGDEIEVIIDDDENQCWKINFLSCYKVSYETDVNCRKIANVKNMKKSQLGYFGQEIKINESNENDFYDVYMDLSIMIMNIECKEIQVSKAFKSDFDFFWNC